MAPFHGFVWRDGSEQESGLAGDADGAEPLSAAGAATGVEPAATPSGGFGVNHDKSHRPRRQDRPQDLLETGAAYAMRAAGFREHAAPLLRPHRAGRTDPARVLEIDDPHDLDRARALAPLLDAPPARCRPATTSTRSYSTSTAPRPTTGC